MRRHIQRLMLAIVAAALSPLLASPDVGAAGGPVVTITVAGIKPLQGFLMIALHDEAGWSGAAIARTRIPASGATVTTTLPAPKPGRYGIKMFHDLNGDGVMETNIVGIPTEPFGFSNNAPVRMGPPAFAEAAFDVGPAGAKHTITLK
jgi:uncharacterized protein (DUF2141 family)